MMCAYPAIYNSYMCVYLQVLKRPNDVESSYQRAISFLRGVSWLVHYILNTTLLLSAFSELA